MAKPAYKVHVSLGDRSYEIEIGTGNLDRVGQFAAALRHVSHAVVITDANVHSLYGSRVAESLKRCDARVDVEVVAAGERSKSPEVAQRLWQRLLALHADRQTLVVAVGGGVVGDLAGFIAATFARGLPLLQIPTTLLAQVDSSVGGKVGVNLSAAKNMVGAFWQPIGVLIDTAALHSLSEREYSAGLAEVVKYGVILDDDFFAYLEASMSGLSQRDDAVLRKVVARCCQLKADVVTCDERETIGLRAVLNYGHTFAHAFEALAKYQGLLHGEAVAIGMMCAARLAERLGRVDRPFIRRQLKLLSSLKLPVDVPDVDAHDVLQVMQSDKKVAHGRLRFVLPSRIGHVELVEDVSGDDVRAALVE